jgi:nucleoside-diphosphate-sugar epimerase
VKRLLLTGASGFIGSQAVALLAQRGFEVHAVSSREVAGAKPEEAIVWHRVDLLDPGSTRALVREVRPTHLLHFAWYAKHGEFWTSSENLRWVEASLGLLRAFDEYGGRRVVIAGTCAEYDWSKVGHCVEDSSPLAPRTLYGASKDALRRVAQAWARERDISLAWGRVFFVFGEREWPERLVPSVARAVLAGRPAPCSHGLQLRDFLHTADAAGAFVALLDSAVEGAVNVGSGQPVSIGELVRLVGEVAGRADLVRLGELPERPGEPQELSADVTRLCEEVGWRPTLTLEQGVELAVRWQRSRVEASAARGDGGS